MQRALIACCFMAGAAVFLPVSPRAEDAAASAERIKTLEAKVDTLAAKMDLMLQLQQSGNTAVLTPPAAPGTPPVVSLTAPPPPLTQDVPAFVEKEDHIPVVAAPPLDNSPDAQYKAAFRLISEGKYDEAAGKFRTFIAANGSHKLVPLAHYWLGEIHYEKKELQQAHDAFMASYQSDPTSEKGSESLLKMAIVLKELQQPQQACAALDILKRDYPESQAAARAKTNTDLAQTSCDVVPTAEIKRPAN